MRPRSLLILFLLVAGLGAFVWFYERDLPGTDERAERAKRLLPDFDADEVTGLEVTTEKGTVSLARSGSDEEGEADSDSSASAGWRIIDPLEARADEGAISTLLSTLGTLEKKRTIEDLDAASAGLAEPRARLTIHGGDEATVLALGDSVPASSDVLVELGGGPPYFVTGGSLADQIDKAPGDWRDRDLFPAVRSDIDRVRVTTGAGTLLLARRGEDFWVEEPYTDRADAGAMSKLLTALTGLRAEEFVDEPVEGAGLEDPGAELEVVLKDREEPFRVALGAAIEGETPRRYARVDGQRVEIQDQLWGAVAGDPVRWHSLAWTSLDAFEVDRLEVRHGEDTFTLERSEGEWTRDGERIPFSVASDLLYALTGAEAEQVEEGSLVNEPVLRVVLEASERSQTLQLFAADENRHPATVDDRPVVLWLGAETVDDIEAKVDAVRDAEADGGESDDAATSDSPS